MIYTIYGKGININSLHQFYDNSYKQSNDQHENIDGYIRDHSLSDDKVQVYHNPTTSQAVISHRGSKTKSDWLHNMTYPTGFYKYTPRYKHAKNIQDQAESKYGSNNKIHTIGHSQGGILAELLGQKSDNIITMNRPILPKDVIYKTKKNHYDIRANSDPVSLNVLNNLQSKSNKDLVINSNSYNPLINHSYDTLKNLDQNTIIGNGLIKNNIYMKGHNIHFIV